MTTRPLTTPRIALAYLRDYAQGRESTEFADEYYALVADEMNSAAGEAVANLEALRRMEAANHKKRVALVEIHQLVMDWDVELGIAVGDIIKGAQ